MGFWTRFEAPCFVKVRDGGAPALRELDVSSQAA